MSNPDPQLIKRCQQGDAAAWRTLVDRYAGLVMSIARRSGLPADVCEDVAQLVFAEFARQLGHIRAEERLAGWFGVVTRRESWRARQRVQRRAARETALESEPADEPPAIEDLETKVAVRAAVRQLGPPCQALIELLFFSDPEPSYADVSQKLGMAPGSIGPTRRRCLAKLMQLLADDHT